MRRIGLALAALTGAALLAGGAHAGGILCMLQGRDVTIGKVAPEAAGGARLAGERGGTLAIGEGTTILRIERVRASDLRPGEQFVARNGRDGKPSPVVVLFKDVDDLAHLYGAMGHRTSRPALAPAAQPARNATRCENSEEPGGRYVVIDGKRVGVGIGKGLYCPKCRVIH
jgi:hypothetical protein